jgi:hypothetical protein
VNGPALWAVVAIVAIVVYTLVYTTVFRYQRFALDVARATSLDLGGDNRRQIRALQRCLTPVAVNSISWLCYVVLATGFVFAFRTWHWTGAAPLLVWAYGGTYLLHKVWPLPSSLQCVQIATSEVTREGQLPNLEPDERELVREAVLKQLKSHATG